MKEITEGWLVFTPTSIRQLLTESEALEVLAGFCIDPQQRDTPIIELATEMVLRGSFDIGQIRGSL
jgi:hypothetical protein